MFQTAFCRDLLPHFLKTEASWTYQMSIPVTMATTQGSKMASLPDPTLHVGMPYLHLTSLPPPLMSTLSTWGHHLLVHSQSTTIESIWSKLVLSTQILMISSSNHFSQIIISNMPLFITGKWPLAHVGSPGGSVNLSTKSEHRLFPLQIGMEALGGFLSRPMFSNYHMEHEYKVEYLAGLAMCLNGCNVSCYDRWRSIMDEPCQITCR